jgi:Rieske Fe-S protein
MGLLARILGICRTSPPSNADCWSYSQGKIEIQLERAQELSGKGGAIRLEGNGLPKRVLVFYGNDEKFHALTNKCTHIGGRRIDPMPDSETVECCSVMGSTYNYDGDVVSGPAKKPLTPLAVESADGKLIVSVA